MTKREDPHAGMRGQWDVSGAWWCDCPARNGDTLYSCRRCGVRRPLKGSPVYAMQRDSLQGSGFMSRYRLVRSGARVMRRSSTRHAPSRAGVVVD